ncbi:MAG: hypothetical protein WCH21_08895 [Bacteroidota bacterium]|jgi:hypothetical protein
MKKLILVLCVAVVLSSCGGSSTKNTSTCDSTCVDTCKVAVDSTALKVDSLTVDTAKSSK